MLKIAKNESVINSLSYKQLVAFEIFTETQRGNVQSRKFLLLETSSVDLYLKYLRIIPKLPFFVLVNLACAAPLLLVPSITSETTGIQNYSLKPTDNQYKLV